MAPYVHNEHPNRVVRGLRHVYNPIGFKKGYNAILWFIFSGALLGFTLTRLSYLNFWDRSSPSSFINNCGPGEIYWVNTSSVYKTGMTLHLGAILPCSLLVLLQFIPATRHRLLLFHRVNGYVVYTLTIASGVGALMVTRRAFGGELAAQAYSGFLTIFSIGGSLMAYINVKRLQLDQHRAWMLRVWAFMGTIVTLRIIQVIMMVVLTKIGSYWHSILCGQLAAAASLEFMNSFSSVCAQGGERAYVSVNVDFAGTLPGTIAALEVSFGTSGWLALVLHAFGVELYLKMTPAESERLRQLSYQRQIERGFKNPGSAGLVADRWGDAEKWVPRSFRDNGEVGALASSGSGSDDEVAKPQGVASV